MTPDGKPTSRYLEYRDHSRAKQVLGQAIRKAYDDIFLIKEHPTAADRTAIEGKFKSYHNVSDNLAGLMAKTFFALLPLADLSAKASTGATLMGQLSSKASEELPPEYHRTNSTSQIPSAGLHYNIQIHLPATKDVEVYNAIFKSVKEHLF